MSNVDLFTKVGNPGTGTTLTTPGHSVGGTTFKVVSTANWPTTTGVVFAVDTYTVDSTGKQIRTNGSYTEWIGDVTDGTTISNAVLLFGTDQAYPAGNTTRVYIPVSSSRENRLVDGMLAQHNQNGSHKAITTTTIMTSGDVSVGGNATISGTLNATGTVTGITPAKFSNPYKFRITRNAALNYGGSFTKIPFDTKTYDTGNNTIIGPDLTTTPNAGRFTAPVAGFYKFTARASHNATTAIRLVIALYKNGVEYSRGSDNTSPFAGSNVYDEIQLAIGDYVEVYCLAGGGVGADVTSPAITYFTGSISSNG